MTTDMSEKGLESLIVAWMTGETTPAPSADAHETSSSLRRWLDPG